MQANFQLLAVKSFLALERVKDWSTSGELTHRKAFMAGMAIALTASVSMAAPAAGAGTGTPPSGTDTLTEQPLARIGKIVCSIANFLQGPIGIGIIVACVVVAGLSLAFGGRNSTSLLMSAIIGAVVVFGARTMLGFITGGGTGGTAGGGFTCDGIV